jgi:hypothetical protein
MIRLSSFLISFVLLFSAATEAISQAWDGGIEKDALQKALEQDTACNAKCASALALVIIDKSTEEAVDLVASVKKAAAQPPPIQLAMLYALLRRTATRGEKIVSSHGACSNQCDKLNADAVALARAGVLGPMLRDGKVDPAVFKDPRIVDIYMKYIKPIPPGQLPWQFNNEDWWKKLSSTS